MGTILVTGVAGFIGFHLSQKLLHMNHQVLGIDNLNDYYDVALKRDRLSQLLDYPNFEFHQIDVSDRDQIATFFATHQPDIVIHLAAQAGVRYSLTHPHTYADINLTGFLNILEGCRHGKVQHLVFASSSSVYGANTKIPFSIDDPVDRPVSLYAATKRANELMAYTYSHLYGIPTTGLRFFTVYGPWGRPDMAYFSFTHAILSGQPIKVFNHGNMRRDFTYIDDIVEGIIRVCDRIPQSGSTSQTDNQPAPTISAPYQLYNIGNHQPVSLLNFIETLEKHLGIVAKKELLPMQPGDVPETYADIKNLEADTGFRPTTPLDVGLKHFVDWYCSYYNK